MLLLLRNFILSYLTNISRFKLSSAVFHVTDQDGNKVFQDNIVERIQQSLGPRGRSFQTMARSVGVQSAEEHTTIELSGRDRPSLLLEVLVVLADLNCIVVAAEVWTHNSRVCRKPLITVENCEDKCYAA
ncbi:ACT domain-containing protein ACR4-like [Forsythia ovata]|uniref:ACT domain-containing protein ACR n=1 Tax=Forsythia ovata TaxID=205694 RepID=A0ABD1UCE8_9LAMI